MVEPKYRRPLNDKQLSILHELYRFRIGTTDLLTTVLHAPDKNRLNRRLTILLEQGYIGRIFEPSYRLIHKHASFYLKDAGVKALKNIPEHKYSLRVLANIKRLKNPSDKFVEHSQGVFEISNHLKRMMGDSARLFTKSELADFDYFPEQRPDAFIRLKTTTGEQQYLLEYIESSTPFRAILGKLKSYIKYSDDGEWEVTNSPLPPILLVCDSPELERRLQKYGLVTLEEADDEVLKIYTTSKEKLKSKTAKTWTRLGDEEDGSGDYGRVEDEFIMPASGA